MTTPHTPPAALDVAAIAALSHDHAAAVSDRDAMQRERDAARSAHAELAAAVRAYLAAEETMRLVAADDHRRDTYREWAARHGAAMDTVDAARAALVAGVARCAP